MAAGLPDLLRAGEVARIFRVHTKTVYGWAKKGRLTVVRTPGGQARYLRDEVHALLAPPS